MFRPVDPAVDFPALERDVLKWWEDEDILKQYLHRNDGSSQRFSFLDGPITANNPMGVHHAWGRTYKDLFQRYKTMCGFRQRYQNGFDCQGLWVEVEVEKELGLGSKQDIEHYGVAEFVNRCKERVLKYSDRQTQQSWRLGYWMDWDNSYFTMADENNYAIWQFLKECHRRGWIYKGYDVMPWCARCGTGLSEHEIVTEGYKLVSHPSITVRLPVEGQSDHFFLIWTTTPWTLPANVALAVNPDEDYVKLELEGHVYYVSKTAGEALSGRVTETMKGQQLLGLSYRGPFDELPVQQGVRHRVISWDDVDPAEGTGIVHIAPGCGREDFMLSRQHDLDIIKPIDDFGVYGEGFAELSGREASTVAEMVFESLRQKDYLFELAQISHRYPICWRCNTELVFRLVDEWFISMDELRHEIMEVVPRIRWIPGFGLERELDWLRNMGDWMISKKRYWGLALPIFECDCGRFEVIGSREELQERACSGWEEFDGNSPHRPWVDGVKIRCSDCGEVVSRIRDVGNPWLDAGIVPFSTMGYWQDRQHWRDWFPADFITESFPGQFRNWFYSLLCMSTVLESSEPFRCVLGHGLVRDENGEDMHKSKGNAIWFDDAAEEMGADSMRWIYAAANPAANLNFGYGVVGEARRTFMLPLWNVYSFFVTYARLDGFDPGALAPEPGQRGALDRWLLSRLNQVVAAVRERMDDFDPRGAARQLDAFVGDLSNWYVRRGRRRYWKSDRDADKQAAYATLYQALETTTRLLAPFLPFTTEAIYQNLVRSWNGEAPVSVHLGSYPEADLLLVDVELEAAMRLARTLVGLGRSARNKAAIKIRQPLASVSVLLPAEQDVSEELAGHILEELNVKELRRLESAGDVQVLTLKGRAGTMGPKFKGDLNAILGALREMDADTMDRLARQSLAGKPVEIAGHMVDCEDLEVSSDDREGYVTASDAEALVAVSTALTEELRLEGLAREVVRQVQNLRRESGLEVDDQIILYCRSQHEQLARMLERFGDYVRGETLAHEILPDAPPADAVRLEKTLDGLAVLLGLKKR